MKRTLTLLLLLSLLPCGAAADMFPAIPDNFWAFGPSLGYTWSDNLSGWTVGFEAVQAFALFTCSTGVKYVFSDSDKSDFTGNEGLLTLYLEGTVSLPFPLGIGVSYNFALGDSNGPGLQLYYGVPLPISRKYYISLFWRPSWIWLDGNPETMHEFGIYFKRSNYGQKQQEAARRRYEWRMRYLKERRQAATNRRASHAKSKKNP